MQISPLLAKPADTTTSAVAKTSLAGDFDKFLRLLTTQLQNQDPMSPMDATQFTQQLVQFSQVEQQIGANKKLDAVVQAQTDATRLGQLEAAQSYIGKRVDALSDTVPLQDGSAEIVYAIETGAKAATVRVLDSAKRTVATLTADATAGAHRLTWNGRGSSGQQLPDGEYRIVVSAADQAGKAVATQAGFSGRVDDVANSDGTIVLRIGGTAVPLAQVTALRAAAAS